MIGIADLYRTVTGFEVTPVVGIVPPDLPLSPHPGEVAAVFEAPLHYLLDPAHQHVRDRRVARARAPLLRDRLGGSADLGSDRGDDRQSEPAARAGDRADDAARRALADSRRHEPAARRARRRARARRAMSAAACATRCSGSRSATSTSPPGSTPDEVIEAARSTAGIKAVPTGLAHGTITAVIGGAPVEVTTLRRDVATDGRRATVAFTEDWREDAARRDFTINALCRRPDERRDLRLFRRRRGSRGAPRPLHRRSAERIAEDHLRILRFFRFHARFGDGAPDAAGARGLRRARQRPDGAVARADRRRAAEAARARRSGADRRR